MKARDLLIAVGIGIALLTASAYQVPVVKKAVSQNVDEFMGSSVTNPVVHIEASVAGNRFLNTAFSVPPAIGNIVPAKAIDSAIAGGAIKVDEAPTLVRGINHEHISLYRAECQPDY